MPKVKGKTKKKKNSSVDAVLIFMIICALVAYYALTFGTGADLLNKIYNQNMINAYNNTMVSYSNDDLASIKQNMIEYNNSIYQEQQTKTFHYRGPVATDETYASLPTASDEIGSVRIPSINVNVSFCHGTGEATLQSEAGHLYGTSFPIDGENVHAVIVAHSALSTASLFTDLTKVKEGDKFYVTVLNTEYEYTVDQIKVVLPEDDYQYEQIEKGKNYVTLYTCTPYGVNTHRLLVRGELTGQKEVELDEDDLRWKGLLTTLKYASELGLVVCFPGIAAIGYAAYVQKNDKKRKKKKIAKKSAKASQ